MTSYTRLPPDALGNERVDQVMRDDGVNVLTGVMPSPLGGTMDVPAFADPDGLAYRAWLAAGNEPGPPLPKPREAYGDDLIRALSDAEMSALSSGSLHDQRMLSAQRVPFRATDDLIVRLAAVMKIDPAAWLARVPG